MTFDKISGALSRLGDTVKALAKVALLSRKSSVVSKPRERRLIILGNGPSLNDTLRDSRPELELADLMAVNFAANAPVFTDLKPEYYILADPHFFSGDSDPNVVSLYSRLAAVDWPMTLYLPARAGVHQAVSSNPSIRVERFNPVGAEGFHSVVHRLYDAGRAMPRPRNVLIAAIMTGLNAGYKTIYLTGADHSWPRTLSVDDDNTVVSVQPHFYADDSKEKERVTAVYRNVRLHEIMYSFHVAFKAYHQIADYAASRGARIFNATPGSFIDAFPRRGL